VLLSWVLRFALLASAPVQLGADELLAVDVGDAAQVWQESSMVTSRELLQHGHGGMPLPNCFCSTSGQHSGYEGEEYDAVVPPGGKSGVRIPHQHRLAHSARRALLGRISTHPAAAVELDGCTQLCLQCVDQLQQAQVPDPLHFRVRFVGVDLDAD
jgi:hypothetical protein